MTVTTMSSREFAQNIGGAKHAAANGPVVITDRGQPAHVLLTFEDYRRLRDEEPTLLDALSRWPERATDFEPPRLAGPVLRAAAFD